MRVIVVPIIVKAISRLIGLMVDVVSFSLTVRVIVLLVLALWFVSPFHVAFI
mgnify:CR=1 FL=1